MRRLPSVLIPQSRHYRHEVATEGDDGLTERRKGISSISQRVAVTVSVMAFGSVVESNSCANPISDLLRVYFRTRAARPGIGVVRVPLYRGQADFHATDTGLSFSIKRSRAPPCPVFSSSPIVSHPLFTQEVASIRRNIFEYISLLSGSRVGTDPFARTPSIVLYFSRSAYFSSIYSVGWLRAAKGTMGSRIYQGGFVSLFAYCLAAEHRAVHRAKNPTATAYRR